MGAMAGAMVGIVMAHRIGGGHGYSTQKMHYQVLYEGPLFA